MSDKVAIIDDEFTRLIKKLEMNHKSIINNYEIIIRKLEEVVSETGPLYAPQFSPKVKELTETINTDILVRLEKLFEVTEEVIKNYEETIVNLDTSDNK